VTLPELTAAEELVLDHGIGVVRHPVPELSDRYIGFAFVMPNGDVGAVLRDSVDDPEVVELFYRWTDQVLTRFRELGPEVDGWTRSAEGAWQFCARLVEMPRLE
jgi:hypothetical protein